MAPRVTPRPDEQARIAALRELIVLDSAPEPMFDEIARLASEVCGAPIALMSLVDAERQWFKANVGLPGVNETPRDVAFCDHAIRGDSFFEIADATRDARFAANPLVTGAPDIRFYAAAPLLLPDGERVGTLCVIDRQARQLDEVQSRMLRSLADIAVKGLILRRDLINKSLAATRQMNRQLVESERFLRQITDALPVRMAYVDREQRYRFVNQAHSVQFGKPVDQIIGRTRGELTAGSSDKMVDARVEAALAGQLQRFEYEETVNGECVRIESHLIPDVDASGQVKGFFSTGTDITARAQGEEALRDLTAILDNTSDFVVQADWKGNIRYMNPAARRVSGLADDEPVTHRNFAEFHTPATARHFAEVISPAVQAGGVWVGLTTIYGAGKREIPVSHLVLAHRDAHGRVDRYSAVMRDVSAEVKATQQEQRLNATLRSITETIPAFVSVIGIDGRYRFVNAGFEQWRGLARDKIVGCTMPEVLGSVEYERSRPWVERALKGEGVHFEKGYPARGGTTHLGISYMPLWMEDGSIDGVIGVAQDITKQKHEEVRLMQMTQRDPLTGLLNRAGFEQHLELQVSSDLDASTALLYIDLDRFKPVNDQHGHPVGDLLLQAFAQRLKKLVRPDDAVARVGGDEFAVVLSGVRAAQDVQAVAEKIVAAAGAPFSVGTLQLRIGASVGAAFGMDRVGGWRDLVARADAHLYQAKAGGRGRTAAVSCR